MRVEVRLPFVLGNSAPVVRAEPMQLVDAVSWQGLTDRNCIFCCRHSATHSGPALERRLFQRPFIHDAELATDGPPEGRVHP